MNIVFKWNQYNILYVCFKNDIDLYRLDTYIKYL